MELIRLYNQNDMAKIDIVSKSDFDEFKEEVLGRLDDVLNRCVVEREWLKSADVQELLNISSGTLKTLREGGHIQFSKLGGSLYYNYKHLIAFYLSK